MDKDKTALDNLEDAAGTLLWPFIMVAMLIIGIVKVWRLFKQIWR